MATKTETSSDIPKTSRPKKQSDTNTTHSVLSETIIFWFRRDLRLSDNAALREAAKQGPVLAVYILDDRPEFSLGSASQWWLHHALASLNESLQGKLVLFKGDATHIIPRMVGSSKAKAVYWTTCYEPAYIHTDQAIQQKLATDGVAAHTFEGSLLWPLPEVVKKDGTPYKVYTPFLRACLAAPPPRPTPAKAPLFTPDSRPAVGGRIA